MTIDTPDNLQLSNKESLAFVSKVLFEEVGDREFIDQFLSIFRVSLTTRQKIPFDIWKESGENHDMIFDKLAAVQDFSSMLNPKKNVVTEPLWEMSTKLIKIFPGLISYVMLSESNLNWGNYINFLIDNAHNEELIEIQYLLINEALQDCALGVFTHNSFILGQIMTSELVLPNNRLLGNIQNTLSFIKHKLAKLPNSDFFSEYRTSESTVMSWLAIMKKRFLSQTYICLTNDGKIKLYLKDEISILENLRKALICEDYEAICVPFLLNPITTEARNYIKFLETFVNHQLELDEDFDTDHFTLLLMQHDVYNFDGSVPVNLSKITTSQYQSLVETFLEIHK